jgi:hypothetical protein
MRYPATEQSIIKPWRWTCSTSVKEKSAAEWLYIRKTSFMNTDVTTYAAYNLRRKKKRVFI